MGGKDEILREINKNLTKLIELKTKEYEKQSWTGFYVVSLAIFVINLFRYDWNFLEALLISAGVVLALAIIFWWLFAPLCFYVTNKIYGYDPGDRVKEIKEWKNKKYFHTGNDDINKLNTINNLILGEINTIHENHQNLLKKEQEVRKENIRTVIKYTLGVASVMVILVLVAISIDKNKQHQQTTITSPQAPVVNEQSVQEETPVQQEEQQPQETPTQDIVVNPPIKQSPQSKPKEVYTPPQNNSISPEYLAAEQAHFNAIFSAHPDAESIVQSQTFKNWINNQSASNQSYYNNVLNNGSAAQVINMFSQYKKDLRSSQNNQKPVTPPPQPKTMSPQDIYEKYQKPLIPSADKPLEVQSAENMPEM